MDLGIAGRVAFVAASTDGLGWAVASALGHEGVRVAVTGRRGALAVERAATLPHAIGIELDLTDPRSVDAALARTTGELGEVDILVLNSGGPPRASALDVTADQLRDAFELLLMPHHRLIGATVPAMRKRGWGRVLAIGSTGVQEPIPLLVLSNSIRAALAGLLKTLAHEVAADGVTVNMLLPGRISTGRVGSVDQAVAESTGQSLEEIRAGWGARVPVGRYGRPDEFGAVAAFLCGRSASYITGEQLRVDGGLVGGR